MRLYLDAPPVIYYVQNTERFAEKVWGRLAQDDVQLVASDLTRLECRVKPIREGSTALLAEFDVFFETALSEMIPLTTPLIDLATEIRAEYGFRTPDAIHLAAAVTAHCDVFFTNDHRLDTFDRVRVELVER